MINCLQASSSFFILIAFIILIYNNVSYKITIPGLLLVLTSIYYHGTQKKIQNSEDTEIDEYSFAKQPSMKKRIDITLALYLILLVALKDLLSIEYIIILSVICANIYPLYVITLILCVILIIYKTTQELPLSNCLLVNISQIIAFIFYMLSQKKWTLLYRYIWHFCLSFSLVVCIPMLKNV